MPAGGNHGKRKARFPPFPRRLGNLAKTARFPHSHSADGLFIHQPRRQNAEKLVCRGKVEIQNQDSHFPTAPMACGARKELRAAKLRSLTTARRFAEADENHCSDKKTEAVYTDPLTTPGDLINLRSPGSIL